MPNKPDMVRIIRDSRDARRDYFLPRAEAKRLFDLGKLVRINAEGVGWDYAHPQD